MKLIYISSLIVALLFVNVAYSVEYQFATCVFGGFGYFKDKDERINGSIQILKTETGNIKFHFDITGLADGTYGIQVFDYGLHTSNSVNLGNVFNPKNLEKGGCPSGTPRVGDLGNVEIVKGEVETALVEYTAPSIADDESSIIGRSIAIFKQSYDCEKGVYDFDKANLLNYCTVGIGNSTFINDAFAFDVALGDVNTARSYSQLGNNILALVEVFNTEVVPEDIEGKVFFKNINETFVQINSEIKGLSYKGHGFHIHQYGERSDMTGYAIGGHWFEGDQTHALPENKTRHYGDMGNFCAFNSDMGSGYYHYETDYFKVADLLGRGMAVHDNTDNGTYVGGARVAQGVIALVDPQSGEVVQLPNTNWRYDIICANGAYIGDGDASSYSSFPTDEPSSASTASTFITLVILSIISVIILI